MHYQTNRDAHEIFVIVGSDFEIFVIVGLDFVNKRLLRKYMYTPSHTSWI
jgi:hypothetical protein